MLYLVDQTGTSATFLVAPCLPVVRIEPLNYRAALAVVHFTQMSEFVSDNVVNTVERKKSVANWAGFRCADCSFPSACVPGTG